MSMKNSNYLLCASLIAWAMFAPVALASNTSSSEVVSYAKKIGDICAVRIDSAGEMKRLKSMPAVFWLMSRTQSKGELSAEQLQAIRPAISCEGQAGIVVDEKKAEAILLGKKT